jgi:hypothetical protein
MNVHVNTISGLQSLGCILFDAKVQAFSSISNMCALGFPSVRPTDIPHVSLHRDTIVWCQEMESEKRHPLEPEHEAAHHT